MSLNIREAERITDIVGDYDVAICGGGPAGFIAAVAAARSGAKTLLIHEHGFLGGMATAALVGPISKFNFAGKRIVGGIPEEFIDRMAALGGAVIDLPSGNIPFDPEIYKLVAMQMVVGSGAEMMLHTRAVGVHRQADELYLLTEAPSGRKAVKARRIIDATGTASVIAAADLPWNYRRADDGSLQPMSLVFRLGGVDTDDLTVWMDRDGVKYANAELRTALENEVVAGNIAQFGGPWAVFGSTIRKGEVSVNATRYPGDATDTASFTQAEISMRLDVMKMVELFRKASPQFKNCYLIDTAFQAGIRETRTIDGLYTLTADDILNPKDFDDTVAKGAHWIDIHRAGDSSQSATYVPSAYNIPFRSLVPKGSDHIIVAGGSISATKEAFASVRVQAQCMALGQAAGTAAAMSLSDDQSFLELNGSDLREKLAADGAIVD